MEYGIAAQAIIPVRAEPSHRAEMVTQVLFGEMFRITAQEGSWCGVSLIFDGYEGWMEQKQISVLSASEFLTLEQVHSPVCMDLVQLIFREKHQDMMPVVLGSSLPGFQDGHFSFAGETYYFEGSLPEPSTDPFINHGGEAVSIRKQLTGNAMLYLNAPYLWGGRSPLGIDCSGLVQMVYKLLDMQLYRDASRQATQGEVIGMLFEALPGDLAFFDNEEGNITHVGVLLGQNRIIHSSGIVRIDHIDQEGIFDQELKKYTHRLRLIKRLF